MNSPIFVSLQKFSDPQNGQKWPKMGLFWDEKKFFSYLHLKSFFHILHKFKVIPKVLFPHSPANYLKSLGGQKIQLLIFFWKMPKNGQKWPFFGGFLDFWTRKNFFHQKIFCTNKLNRHRNVSPGVQKVTFFKNPPNWGQTFPKMAFFGNFQKFLGQNGLFWPCEGFWDLKRVLGAPIFCRGNISTHVPLIIKAKFFKKKKVSYE